MSLRFPCEAECNFCGHVARAMAVSSANATASPALREAALAGTLNRYACPNCEAWLEIEIEVRYWDLTRGHVILVAPQHVDIAKSTLQIDAEIAEAVKSGPPFVREMFQSLQRRICHSLDDLRERLLIWRDGVDDIALRAAKRASIHDAGWPRYDGCYGHHVWLVWLADHERHRHERRRILAPLPHGEARVMPTTWVDFGPSL